MLCFIGCSVLKMPYTPLVSVFVGVTNVIPFFGPFLGAIPSLFLILLVNPLNALYFLLFVLALQQLDGNVIGPKILGDSTGLSAFWVLFAVTFFGGLFGFVGMLIGVPTFAVIYSLIRNIAEYKLGKKGMKTKTPDYAAQDCPIFQKVDYHEGEMAPRSCVGGLRPGRQASGDARAAGRLHGGQLQRGGRQIAACSKLFWNI